MTTTELVYPTTDTYPTEEHAHPIRSNGTDVVHPVVPVTDTYGREAVVRDAPAKKETYPFLGLVIFMGLMSLALILMVIGTPLELYMLYNEYRDMVYPELAGTSDDRMCVTAWGMKHGCRSRNYYGRDFLLAFCDHAERKFRAVQAFCIITIGLMAVSLILGLVALLRKVDRYAVAGVAILAALSATIPWAIVAGMYHNKPCCGKAIVGDGTGTVCHFSRFPVDVPRFKTMGNYAAGFGLLVTAWCLAVLACLLPFFPPKRYVKVVPVAVPVHNGVHTAPYRNGYVDRV